MEQRLQLILKGNTTANLYFSGTEFQSVLAGRENAEAFVRKKLETCQRIYSALTDHRHDEMFRNVVSVFDTLLTI